MIGNDVNSEALRNLRRAAEAAAVSQAWFAGPARPQDGGPFGGVRDPRVGRAPGLAPRPQEAAGPEPSDVRGPDWFGARLRPELRPDLHGPGPHGPHGPRRLPPEHLQPIVQQLLTGATDLTASRQLGLSPRTYSRRVSELLEYLGVESRFQAGVEAARRGWLPPPRTPADSALRPVPAPRLHCETG